MLAGNNILLIISGGIAAYKSLDLIRRMRERGASVTPVMTQAACEFVTPLSVSALAGVQVYHDLFDLTAESDMGHIQLSRSADLVVVAPATADLIAKMANGLANDLASTLLLATDTPVLIAPAMNVRMWDHPATQRNLAQLVADGVHIVGPNPGDMACGEYGPGRMSEPLEIIDAIAAHFAPRPLEGHKVLVTSGPTHEPIDPVRYIANRSSGAQGTAIAAALRDLGADVRFVTGPADVPPPNGVQVIQVESAYDMFDAVKANLDVSCAIFAAAVADWRVENASGSKIKKQNGSLPELSLTENPDILAHVAQLGTDARPPLVIGFAAETDDVIENATDKRARKGCDWIVANDVSPETEIMGGSENQVILVTEQGADQWPRLSKGDVAAKLAGRIMEQILGTS
ncbi:MAG: bifunctional phosphopantothenoylcysteine decarboxylase/phosphopantothenate--cysteine ligase CoaBC [Rhodobacteraceae bacterium]|jgi:phosphopantothenoylcysteine decarboxylase/phosphopantothenate--cysteine ligase|nr:bifunctional phosphopantothenoylcysteine decarboxylase/phosphopantothenate--cysteine ligase CoaBC [Paracoccaceae bacterium]NCV66625.1 bifunctional phosphopantothenoylcysteine decarboxylase/phosphopantothenate--cysteine ligase CoaBC [Paracoccaceae bacterium]NCW03453.1 bifunctional phosphopantothenoylcysteine decarboxylase/phosphopantothenate--cysteine ligase CoaBC [Paracoccaceae bacterium]NDH72276.1 bifunctional phosphopantothenoylcysteine decarboxylase/phosphopantothenate--cysteine ligase Coa